jgi:hypothetical protein
VGFNERIGELMWPAAETGGQEASAGDPRPELQRRLLELGIAEEKAVVIMQRQRDLDAAERRRQEL